MVVLWPFSRPTQISYLGAIFLAYLRSWDLWSENHAKVEKIQQLKFEISKSKPIQKISNWMNEFSLKMIFWQIWGLQLVGLFFQNLFGGAVSQNVSHTTTLVAGLGSGVGTVLHDMTDLEKHKFEVWFWSLTRLVCYMYILPRIPQIFLSFRWLWTKFTQKPKLSQKTLLPYPNPAIP